MSDKGRRTSNSRARPDAASRTAVVGLHKLPAVSGDPVPVRVEDNDVQDSAMGLWFKRNNTDYRVSGNTLTYNGDRIRVGWGDDAVAYAEFHNNTIANNGVGVNVSAAQYPPGPPVPVPQTDCGASLAYAGRATLRDNVIADNGYGVLVRAWTPCNLATPSPWVVATRNNITGNTYGVYVRGGVRQDGTVVPAWANLTGNNTISGNAYGVWIHGPTVDPTPGRFWMWWNDVAGNSVQGVHVEGDTSSWGPGVYFYTYCNWWNNSLGPHDLSPGPPDQNINPPGQLVSDYFWYRMTAPPPIGPQLWWLRAESQNATECKPP